MTMYTLSWYIGNGFVKMHTLYAEMIHTDMCISGNRISQKHTAVLGDTAEVTTLGSPSSHIYQS